MWEILLMNVSCLSAIILALVGILKTFFKSFKAKYPKWYKATFFLLSVALVVAGSIIAQLYIVEESLSTWSFAILILGTGVVVLGGYQGYESTNLKTLVNKIFSTLKTWLSSYSDSKVAKMIEKVGIDKIESIASTMVIKSVPESIEDNAGQKDDVKNEEVQPKVDIVEINEKSESV